MFNDRLIRAVDWFVPPKLHGSTATLWRARIFVISHLLGPFSAVAILGYLYRVQAALDPVLAVLGLLCGSFWGCRSCSSSAATSTGRRCCPSAR
jgi:hypothetical protein